MLNQTPMLFPMAPADFWKQIRSTIEEVVTEKINQPFQSPPTDHLPEKALLKLSDVCAVFQVSKPTLYDWLKQDKIKSFKIKSRRYFLRTDIESLIRSSAYKIISFLTSGITYGSLIVTLSSTAILLRVLNKSDMQELYQ